MKEDPGEGLFPLSCVGPYGLAVRMQRVVGANDLSGFLLSVLRHEAIWRGVSV